MNSAYFGLRCTMVMALLQLGCAKVTTSYLDGESGVDAGLGGTAGVAGEASGGTTATTATGGTTSSSNSKATGGAISRGGASATGGLVGSGGATAAVAGSTASGGSVGVAGSTVDAAGGKIGTGGTAATGGAAVVVTAGNSGIACPTGAAFCDDFELDAVGSAAAKWTATGTWAVAADTTLPVGSQKVYANTSTSSASAQVTSGTYTNATIEAMMKLNGANSGSSNSAGIYLRSNGANAYSLSLGGDDIIYLRRDMANSTGETCSSGTNSSSSKVGLADGTSSPVSTGWFKLKLVVSGTKATGITITGYVDLTGSSGYRQVLQCIQGTDMSTSAYTIDSGTAGVFSKGKTPALYDDVVITTQ